MWWLLAGVIATAAPFARVAEKGDAIRLELASRTYAHPDGSEVALVGVSHIGLESFYEAVDAQLSASELVLYEGVGGGPQPGEPEGLNGAYVRLAEGLGLRFQMDVLDYSNPSWKNSDLSVEELTAATGQGEVLADLLDGGGELAKMDRLAARAARSELIRVMARVMLVESLPRAEGMLEASLGSALHAQLVVARNDRVWSDLARARGQRVAVLYGAAHLRDLEERLLEQGFEATGEVWTPAIDADPVASGVPPKVLAAVRKKVQKKLDRMEARQNP